MQFLNLVPSCSKPLEDSLKTYLGKFVIHFMHCRLVFLLMDHELQLSTALNARSQNAQTLWYVTPKTNTNCDKYVRKSIHRKRCDCLFLVSSKGHLQ